MQVDRVLNDVAFRLEIGEDVDSRVGDEQNLGTRGRPRSSVFTRRLLVVRRFWSCPTSKPATCAPCLVPRLPRQRRSYMTAVRRREDEHRVEPSRSLRHSPMSNGSSRTKPTRC
jgi:hypothetical protein